MPRDPKFWPTDPKFCGKFESELLSGFRARSGMLKGSGVSGSEGDNSPFRGARPTLISYSDSPYPKPHSTHFFGTRGCFWADLTNRTLILPGPRSLFRPENLFGSVNPPKIPVGVKKNVERGFGYGESEYEGSFGLAPRNGELSNSGLETLEPFNSPFWSRNRDRSSYSNFPDQNLMGIHTQRKTSIVILLFVFKMANSEITLLRLDKSHSVFYSTWPKFASVFLITYLV